MTVGRSISHLTLVDLDNVADDDRTANLKEALLAVEGQAAIETELTWLEVKGTGFADFVQKVVQGKFTGTLICLLSAKRFNNLADRLSSYSVFVREQISFLLGRTDIKHEKPFDSSDCSDLDHLLALAELVAANGQALILIERPKSFFSRQSIPAARPSTTAGPPFRFRVAFTDQLDESLIATLMARDKIELGTTELRLNKLGLGRGGGWSDYELNPLQECQAWYGFEFYDQKTRRVAQRLCDLTFAPIPEPDISTVHRLRFDRVLLAAMRVTARMTNLTFEGAPFECTVVLTSDYKTHVAPSNQLDLVRTNKPLYFNFLYWDQLRDLAELAQEEDLRLVVDARTSRVESVLTEVVEKRSVTPRRKELARLAGHFGISMRVHAGRYVEVFAPKDQTSRREGFQYLWFNGDKWRPSPFVVLDEVLDEYYALDQTSGRNDKIENLRAAIARMLDNHKHSIICLLDNKSEDDRNTLERILKDPKDHTLELLRPHLDVEPRSLAELSPSAIAGLLHADGAHFIHSDNIVNICVHVGEPHSGLSENHEPGTGRRAARNLHQCFPSSHIISVSSSGDIVVLRPARSESSREWYGSL